MWFCAVMFRMKVSVFEVSSCPDQCFGVLPTPDPTSSCSHISCQGPLAVGQSKFQGSQDIAQDQVRGEL